MHLPVSRNDPNTACEREGIADILFDRTSIRHQSTFNEQLNRICSLATKHADHISHKCTLDAAMTGSRWVVVIFDREIDTHLQGTGKPGHVRRTHVYCTYITPGSDAKIELYSARLAKVISYCM